MSSVTRPDTTLPDTAHRLREFLGRNGEGRWASVIGAALTQHASDEAALARAALRWCTTGLERLTLSPMHGHGVQVCAIDGTNRALHSLRSALVAEAEAILGA